MLGVCGVFVAYASPSRALRERAHGGYVQCGSSRGLAGHRAPAYAVVHGGNVGILDALKGNCVTDLGRLSMRLNSPMMHSAMGANSIKLE